jgi:hypothetical protein
MKKHITISASFSCLLILSQAQPTLIHGREKQFSFKKQPRFTSIQISTGAYFYFKPVDYSSYPRLIAVSNSGNVEYITDLKYQTGHMGNMTDMLNVLSFNDKIIAVMENRNKETKINKLTIREIDNQGTVSTTETEVGSFPFEKMGKSGDWYTSVSPDGKHLAIIGQIPAEKDELVEFKYYFLDAGLKPISSGQFSFSETKKRVFMNAFHASDKGDFYLIKNESEKGYQFPLLYQAKVGATTGTITPITAEDPKHKLMNYMSAVHPNGDLVIAGYLKGKSAITIGDIQAIGSWIYQTSAPKVNISLFEKPVSNATAEGIVFNGNTTYLVGEQLRAEMESRTAQQGLAGEENYNYKHNDILVTAFGSDAVKKFDLNLSRNFSVRNFDQDLYPAFGVINNKLALVYNDQYGKYIPNTSYDNYKMPMLVTITNDGLMEAPVHFDKEFQTTRTTYTLYPQFFSNGSNQHLILLAGNGTSLKGVAVK